VSSFYLDTSAIVKRYAREPGSGVVSHLYRQATTGRSRLCFSEWNVGETLGALQKKARKARRPQGFQRAKGRLHGEISSLTNLGVLAIASVGGHLLHETWTLLERRFLYAADALQIATAKDQRCDYFVTADQDLYDAAKAEGLTPLHIVEEQSAVRKLA